MCEGLVPGKLFHHGGVVDSFDLMSDGRVSSDDANFIWNAFSLNDWDGAAATA